MNISLANKRYLQQRAQARMRNIPFTITFDQWCDIWSTSGKWNQRGRRKDQYCMSRIADQGGYDLGNVFIQLQGDNVKEAQKGKSNLLKGKRTGPSHWKGKKRPEHSLKMKGRIPWNKGKTNKNAITNQGEIICF